jgi:hypothetical protein
MHPSRAVARASAVRFFVKREFGGVSPGLASAGRQERSYVERRLCVLQLVRAALSESRIKSGGALLDMRLIVSSKRGNGRALNEAARPL